MLPCSLFMSISLLGSAVGEWLTLSSQARVGLQAGPGDGMVVVKDVLGLRGVVTARAVYLKRKTVSIILENT